MPRLVNTNADEYCRRYPDGRTVYFAKRSADRKMEHIYSRSTRRGHVERTASRSVFGEYFDKEPFITRDGAKLSSPRSAPLTPRKQPERNDFNLWLVERTGAAGSWGEAKPLGAAIQLRHLRQLSFGAADGTDLFLFDAPGGKGSNDLYCARWVNGGTRPPRISRASTRPSRTTDPYIAPDESYIIISTTRTGTYGGRRSLHQFNLLGP